MNIFGFLFVKKYAYLSDEDINHEKIHTAQMKELLFIPYYIIYTIEYIFRIIFKIIFNKDIDPYKTLSFEKEAYGNECNLEYLKTRKLYAMWRK